MNHTLYIAQKLFSLWGKYDVVDENNQPAYSVEGVPAFMRKQLVYDKYGKEVGTIKQRFTMLLPEFTITENGREVGAISGKFSVFRNKLDVQYRQWNVEGDFWGWNYDVVDARGNLVACIRQELWHLSDHYAIHYANPEDGLSLLMLALAIDCIHDASAANSANS